MFCFLFGTCAHNYMVETCPVYLAMPPRCLRSKLKSKVAHNCVVSLTLTLPGARCSKKHIDQDLLGCKFLELWIHPRKWTSCYLLFGGSGDRVNIDQLLG